jgi:hypothetical protein
MKPIRFKYSREELKQDIKLSQQTQDGVYWCPNIIQKMKETTKEKNRGYDDKEYVMHRSLFFNKPFYTQKDLHYFTNTFFNELCFNYELFKFLNDKFKRENKDLYDINDLNHIIDNNKLKDIIDLFLIYNKYYLI